MKIKPFRQYDENDVINLYSLAESSGNQGDLAELVSWNPSDSDGYDVGAELSPFAGITIPRYVSKAKVKLATSGNENMVLGALLWDVRETDVLGRPLIYTAQRYQELQVVVSGQAVPIVTKAVLIVSGFTGTPGVGSGIGVDNSGLGNWKVIGKDATPRLGTWLSTTGADGYAVARLNISK